MSRTREAAGGALLAAILLVLILDVLAELTPTIQRGLTLLNSAVVRAVIVVLIALFIGKKMVDWFGHGED
jgi:ABC-type branched-subunit amino acid transport system permease subunit